MVSITFHQIQNNFSNWNALYALLFEKQYIKSRTFNDKNRWIIKKVMVLKKLLPHLATRGTYSPGFEGAMKRDVSKQWCVIQWCASRGWFIAHENWTSCLRARFMGPTWGPSGADRTQVGPMLAPWNLSGTLNTLPSWVSCAVLIVKIWEKIYHVITTPHFM